MAVPALLRVDQDATGAARVQLQKVHRPGRQSAYNLRQACTMSRFLPLGILLVQLSHASSSGHSSKVLADPARLVLLRGGGFQVASMRAERLSISDGAQDSNTLGLLRELKQTVHSCPLDVLRLAAEMRARTLGRGWTDVLRECLDTRRHGSLQITLPQFSLPAWPLHWGFTGLQPLDARHGVFEVENFLTADEANEVISLFHATSVHNSLLAATPGQTGCAVRRSDTVWLETAPPVLSQKIVNLLGDAGDPTRHESVSITRYDPGGFYSDHYDNLGKALDGNERAVTILVYLNGEQEGELQGSDVARGGATFFPDLGIRVRPRRGNAAVFFPTLPGSGEENRWLRHCSEDTQSTKWVIQQWIRQRPVHTEAPSGQVLNLAPVQLDVAGGISPETKRSPYLGTRRLGKPKSRILFHHVWKCGGATLCDMAVRNGEAAPYPNLINPSNRCNADSPKELDLLTANISFAEWQAPLPVEIAAGRRTSEFAIVTMMRDPLDQALSHFHHAQRNFGLWSNFSSFIEYGICMASETASGDIDRCQAHLAKMSFDALHPFALFRDNQQLRWLEPAEEGLSVGGRPLLDAQDLASARARLDQFDEVLILEQLHARDRWRLGKYGWSDLDDRRSANSHNPKAPWMPANATAFLERQPDVLRRLREIQRWDLELYEHGKAIARRQAEESAKAAKPRLRHRDAL